MQKNPSTRSRILISLPFVLALSAGCNTDPAKDKTKATVAEAVTAAPATPSPASATKYAFSASGSKLEFIGAKVTGKHDGSFGAFSGTIDVVEGKPEKSSVNVEIETASVKADNDKLTGHLKSPDFFDVAKYPKARFSSTSIAPLTGAAGGATHTVTGNLELHGVTKSISFPAKIQISADSVDVDAEFAINRKDFAIVYPGAPDDLVKDNVLITLTLRAGKATS
ncbi:MAG: YceI family protein [Polyangiaceae bacterium]